VVADRLADGRQCAVVERDYRFQHFDQLPRDGEPRAFHCIERPLAINRGEPAERRHALHHERGDPPRREEGKLESAPELRRSLRAKVAEEILKT
jgi:hypothetical protein